MQIFISYRRTESSDIAGRLHDTLSTYFGENEVFRDVDNIRAADDFVDRLNDVLVQCRVAIIVIGVNWAGERLRNPSDYVRMEVEAALERKIVVVPVLVADSSMPRPEQLPESLRPLCRINALPIRSGVEYQDNTRRLIETLERSVRTLRSRAVIKWHRILRIGAAMLGSLMLAGIGFAWQSSQPPSVPQLASPPSVALNAGGGFGQEGLSHLVASSSSTPVASSNVLFITDRPGATVYLDTLEACRPTPCTIQLDVSRTEIEVQARLGNVRSRKMTLTSPFPSQVELKMTPVHNQTPSPSGTRWLGRFSTLQ